MIHWRIILAIVFTFIGIYNAINGTIWLIGVTQTSNSSDSAWPYLIGFYFIGGTIVWLIDAWDSAIKAQGGK